jgi:hypothetical protein
MATIRRDGSPRISGMEIRFDDDRVTFGLMDDSMKLRDVQRDPRVAFHSPSADPPEDAPDKWVGEAKLAGRAVSRAPVDDADGNNYELDITEVALTRVGTPADHLVIESWHVGIGYQRRTRA